MPSQEVFDAMEEENWSDVKEIVAALEKEEFKQPSRETGNTFLIEAAMLGKDDLVDLLLHCGANIEAINYEECSPLIISASSGQYEVFALLCQRGTNLEALDNGGRSALYRAARNGYDVVVIKILLDAGANPKIQNLFGCTSLHIAA